jgi:hypothetical protein
VFARVAAVAAGRVRVDLDAGESFVWGHAEVVTETVRDRERFSSEREESWKRFLGSAILCGSCCTHRMPLAG